MYKNSNEEYFSDFTKTVLGWDFGTLSKPLDIAMYHMPLPKATDSINQYYQNFLPFILEEARSVIANGLERVNKYSQLQQKKHSSLSDAREFELSLKNKAKLPKNEGNPMFLHFNGKIPIDIEHGNSMNVLLLETTEIPAPIRFIILVTEKSDTSELFAKVIIDSSGYYEYRQCFAKGSKWKAHYLGSIISEQRMYDACLEATAGACMRQISRARIPTPRTLHLSTGSCNMDHLNLSQKKAIYAFLNADEGSTLLLQGPPVTGKTATLVALLKQVAEHDSRTMVSAHSNKGVQVLALRAMDEMPDTAMILVGVASKLPAKLKTIFLHDWYDIILSSFSSNNQEIELLVKKIKIHTSRNLLISNIEQSINTAEQRLNKFSLVYSNELSDIKKQQLYKFSNDPLLLSDFNGFYNNIEQLKLHPQSEHLWDTLLTTLNRLTGKWKAISKDQLEKYLLDRANIIFSTLITAGRKNMLTMEPVDYLLVDEAAQSVEAATLIPMRFRPLKTLLVGDTKQLPATVISTFLDDSDRGNSTHYKWSMMWRLIEENNQPSLMLDIQYRMHPHICQWPSGQYYANQLITSPGILPMPTLDNKNITSRPYAIYQISGQAESRYGSNSSYNVQEAKYVIKIIEHIRKKNGSSSIGVITPYAEQKKFIIENLSQKKYLQKLVDINTVDGFQGDERDIIIISFTRTHVSAFLKEFRRLNVAITRAKFCLIILAAPSLLSNDIGQLIKDAKLRQVLYSQDELNHILNIGVIMAASQKPEEIADLWKMAWQGKPSVQLRYAKTLSNKAEAFLWYRRAAENSNPEAQYYISQIYLFGNDDAVKKDVQLAMLWLHKAAQQNFPQAQYFLGKACILGSIVIKNIAMGIYWCKRAASNNLIDAIVFLAKLYEEGTEVPRNIKYAEKYYRQAARLNDLVSIEKLAGMLCNGTLDDQVEAITWYEKIAEIGISTAYYPLAHLLNVVFNDQDKAFLWYLKAAEHGHSEAQCELGLRFKQGSRGCPKDVLQSKYFFKLAATSGHTQAQFFFATQLKEENNYHEAISFFKLAADHGHCESQYQYALLTYNTNQHKAYSYYLKAANQNHSLAQQECIQYQIQFNRDLKECLGFCEKLAAQGNSKAQFLLARILDTGLIGTIDKKLAYDYYTLLARNGHFLAQYYCAILLERGFGVERDLVIARKYYESCIEQCFGARLRLACLLLRKINEQDQVNLKDHQQSPKTTELYQSPIELLEYYFKHYQEEKSLIKTTEQYLESLILASSTKYSAYEIEVINTNSAQANYLLGRIFQEGVGVFVDINRALQHYKLASTLHPDASYRIGYIYEFGLGVDKNGSTAKKYYKDAANERHELATKRLTWSYWLSTQTTRISKEDNIIDDKALREMTCSNCLIM